MKKILVTGGAGFIGSNLCKKLILKKNHELFSLDNYSTGSKKNHVSGVNYIKGDTKNIFNLIKFKPDIIYHLGEYSRVEKSFDDIEKVIDYNKIGTLNILEFTRKNNCKLVYAGSSTKFGDNGSSSTSSPYSWSKTSNTELVVKYGKWYNINYAITYFYNVYGPGEISEGDYATVIGIFKDLYKKNKSLTVVKPGTQRRNFTHIDDIIKGLIMVGENGYGDDYGIGSKDSYSILEIAKMFKVGIKIIPERKGNRTNASLKTEKTKQLGWKAEKNIVDYIKNII